MTAAQERRIAVRLGMQRLAALIEGHLASMPPEKAEAAMARALAFGRQQRKEWRKARRAQARAAQRAS